MSEEWPKTTARLLVRELRGRPSGRDFVEWAVQALSDGHDTPTLRILAGLDLGGQPSAFEAAVKFRAALLELHIDTPDEASLLRLYVRDVAREIVDGRLAPQDAVARIHREVLTPFEHPAALAPWCYLWEGLDPDGFASLEEEALDDVIRSTARAWAGGVSGRGDG